jgi:predicted HicB family RNase H-like nuclease
LQCHRLHRYARVHFSLTELCPTLVELHETQTLPQTLYNVKRNVIMYQALPQILREGVTSCREQNKTHRNSYAGLQQQQQASSKENKHSQQPYPQLQPQVKVTTDKINLRSPNDKCF